MVNKKTSLIAFSTVFWTFFVLSSVLLFALAVVIRLVTMPFDPNRRVLQKFSCLWASLYIGINPFWSMGKLEGMEHVDRHKAYVMVANHQSMTDILILFRSFLHFKWVSKKSMFRAPLLGWNMFLNGYIPIERGDEKSREACMKKAADWLQLGSSVLFFPEGTRSKDGHLQDFKPGAFRLAIEAGYDILPIVISGTLHALPKHSLLLHRKATMSLKVLPPVSIARFQSGDLSETARRLSDHVHGMMRELT